jgi:hypothetical protein
MTRPLHKVAEARPIPPESERLHPEGMAENSPAFQRWDRGQSAPSPEGTAELAALNRPSGTNPCSCAYPALKRWAILICPFGTGAGSRFPNVACHSGALLELGADTYTLSLLLSP